MASNAERFPNMTAALKGTSPEAPKTSLKRKRKRKRVEEEDTPTQSEDTCTAETVKAYVEEQERKEAAKNELMELINRRADAQDDLKELECAIHSYEGVYLGETEPFGNLSKGFEKYLGRRGFTRHQLPPVPKVVNNLGVPIYNVKGSDRMFSSSSVTSAMAIPSLYKPQPEETNDKESSATANEDFDFEEYLKMLYNPPKQPKARKSSTVTSATATEDSEEPAPVCKSGKTKPSNAGARK